jgi:hypothetical protein
MFGDSLFSNLGSTEGATSLTVFLIVLSAILLIVNIFDAPIMSLFMGIIKWTMKFFGKYIKGKEEAYHRDLEIGKITEKRKKVKLYKFLSDLIIDLNLEQYEFTPYTLLFVVSGLTLVISLIVCKMLFGNVVIDIAMYPIALIAVFCFMYTKANIAHDARIESVIEAENIICANIKVGTVVAVRDSINVIPKNVRKAFVNFLDNVEQKNYHIKTALLQLNVELGSVADDFIKKCIVFELEEEHGIAGMFSDIIEINNINMEMRTDMKRKFEEVKTNFIIGLSMILAFLIGVLAIYENVREFYLTTALGQIILAIDMLIVLIEFVFITALRAKEL